MSQDPIDKIADCPVMTTVAVIGGKWKPRILWLLRDGPLRFSDLKRGIPEASEKMLSEHLRALEVAGVLARREFLDGAVAAVEYSYSHYGRTVIPVLDAMGDWGLRHTSSDARPSI